VSLGFQRYWRRENRRHYRREATPWDLSQALGVTGNPNHPIVQETMDAIVKKARAAGKAVGTICSDAEQAKRLIEKGYQYIGLGGDLNFIGTLGKKYIKEIKG